MGEDKRLEQLKETLGVSYLTTDKKVLKIWREFLRALDKAYKTAYSEHSKLENARRSAFEKKYGASFLFFEKPGKVSMRTRKKSRKIKGKSKTK